MYLQVQVRNEMLFYMTILIAKSLKYIYIILIKYVFVKRIIFTSISFFSNLNHICLTIEQLLSVPLYNLNKWYILCTLIKFKFEIALKC